LACEGLGTDDDKVWKLSGLLGDYSRDDMPGWILERTQATPGRNGAVRPRELDLGKPDEYPEDKLYPIQDGDNAWQWVYKGEEDGDGDAKLPQSVVLQEEPLSGYWERYLLGMTVGDPDVWRWAQDHPPVRHVAQV
jgi:hypothetical protein